MTTGEHFYLFVIQGPKDILEKELHLKEVILNGSHSLLVPISYLYGIDTVKDSIENETIRTYLNNTLNNEII